MDPPINEKHPAWDGETPPRGLWSHDYRPLPYQTEKGAYLPVEGMFQQLHSCRFCEQKLSSA